MRRSPRRKAEEKKSKRKMDTAADAELKECRCCMSKNITSTKKLLDDSLPSIYCNLTGIVIEEDVNEILPLDICPYCHLKLLEFNEFRETCLRSEQFYRGMALLVSIKSEPLPQHATDSELVQVKVEPIFVDEFPALSKDNASVKTEVIDDGIHESDDNESNTVKSEDAASENTNTREKKQRKIKQKDPNIKRKIFTCTFSDCDKTFRVKRCLEGHMREHEGRKPAICKTCGKEFKNWAQHDHHVRRAHEKDPVKCDFQNCDQTFFTMHLMKKHQRADHKSDGPVCHVCGRTFAETTSLKEHLYTHKSQEERPYQCFYCDKMFIRKQALRHHLMRHDGIKNFICPHCGARKTTNVELKNHMLSHQGPERVKYKCPRCETEFNRKENLKRHIRVVHEKIRAFQCTYCDQSFGKAETLKHHVMIHNGERPRKCTICGRGFIQTSSLKIHMASHFR